MRIEVNGEPRELSDGTTLAQLIAHLGYAGERIAVELNREVKRRSLWDDTKLNDGDKIEIVHFVGGGIKN
ncbi:MAG: sulfur carrier protein ThiS [Pyrinomonadaceae bacterium MAG19_C2-C3]|nr:sulfur carrier protein ThiS [Pyrinomonadaceae bacterium MAG19_C2-C3]